MDRESNNFPDRNEVPASPDTAKRDPGGGDPDADVVISDPHAGIIKPDPDAYNVEPDPDIDDVKPDPNTHIVNPLGPQKIYLQRNPDAISISPSLLAATQAPTDTTSTIAQAPTVSPSGALPVPTNFQSIIVNANTAAEVKKPTDAKVFTCTTQPSIPPGYKSIGSSSPNHFVTKINEAFPWHCEKLKPRELWLNIPPTLEADIEIDGWEDNNGLVSLKVTSRVPIAYRTSSEERERVPVVGVMLYEEEGASFPLVNDGTYRGLIQLVARE